MEGTEPFGFDAFKLRGSTSDLLAGRSKKVWRRNRMQKPIVFGTDHVVQGTKNFGNNVADPENNAILGAMIQDHNG